MAIATLQQGLQYLSEIVNNLNPACIMELINIWLINNKRTPTNEIVPDVINLMFIKLGPTP